MKSGVKKYFKNNLIKVLTESKRCLSLSQLTAKANHSLLKLKIMEHLFVQHIQEIAQINQGIAFCNEMICAKSTKEWERKEYQAVKTERMKRKITLVKILKNWN